MGAATLQWILQHLHSKTVLAHIGAFPKKCTTKHSSYNGFMKSPEFYENYITLVCQKQKTF